MMMFKKDFERRGKVHNKLDGVLRHNQKVDIFSDTEMECAKMEELGQRREIPILY
jgi:hypothetical protein